MHYSCKQTDRYICATCAHVHTHKYVGPSAYMRTDIIQIYTEKKDRRS